jgi:hypothetical protein
MQLDLETVGCLLVSFFSPATVYQAACQTNFTQRSTDKLTAPLFFQALVFACLEHQEVTLSQLGQACLDLGVAVSAQGVDSRITQASSDFMAAMFSQAMATFVNRSPLPLPILNQFSAVNLIDSSIIPLPEALAEVYAGCGGNASAASLKVRLVMEFQHGNLSQLLLAPGREPDQGFGAYLPLARPGSLNLMDLGHFNLSHFKAMDDQKAYFLSRYKHGTSLLTPQGDKIDLLALLQEDCPSQLDQPVLLGQQKHHQIPCRLVAFRLKQEVADQRRRKAKAAAKRRGQTVSPTTLALLDWAIYLTNVPQVMLTAEQIALLYRLRWQIELVFKLAKSYLGLRHFVRLRPARVLTELYARLIGLVLTQFITAPLRMPLSRHSNREISPVQVVKIFRRFARILNQALGDLSQVLDHLRTLQTHILHFGFKQKRRKKPNICHALALASTLYQLPFTPAHEVALLTWEATPNLT